MRADFTSTLLMAVNGYGAERVKGMIHAARSIVGEDPV